jgi:hypothetical protein
VSVAAQLLISFTFGLPTCRQKGNKYISGEWSITQLMFFIITQFTGLYFFYRNRLYFAQQEKIYTVWHFPLTIWSHFRLPLLQFILVSCVCAALLYTVVNILLLPIDRKRASTDDSWTHGPLPSDLNSPRPVSLQSCAALPKPLKSGGVFKRL